MEGYIEIKGIEKREAEFKKIIKELLGKEDGKIKSISLNKFKEADLQPEKIILFYNMLGNVNGIGLIKKHEIFEISKIYNEVFLKKDKFVLDIINEWLSLDKVRNI